jgi:hypothetical protein
VSNRILVGQIANFLLFILLQVLIFKNMSLFGVAFPFPYLVFLLLVPLEASAIVMVILGFTSGLVVDVFYDTLGIHAAASVLLGYVRAAWLRIITPAGGYETVTIPKVQDTGLSWFLAYAFPLIFIHQLAIFYLEAGGFTFWWTTLNKVIWSTLFTGVVVILLQYLFFSKKKL